MKILLTHAYSIRNKGDSGIVAGMIQEIMRLKPMAEITVSTMESVNNNPYGDKNVKIVSSVFYETIYRTANPILRIIRLGYVMPVTLLWAYLYKSFKRESNILLSSNLRIIMSEYENADLIVAVGGGYLKTDGTLRGNVAYLILLHSIYLGQLLNKPTYLYPQSIGPISKNMHWITRYLLNRVRRIYVREEISRKILREIGVASSRIYHGVDAGFLLHQSNIIKKRGKVVGITVRNWLKEEAQREYEQAIAIFIQYLTSKGYEVLLIPQVTAVEHNDDDRVPSQRIYSLLDDKENVTLIEEEYDHKKLKQLYSSLRVLIGTRMHSIIFSLTSIVPIIAIGYEHKTEGILRELGLANWMIKIEQVTSRKLINKFEQLLDHETHYRKHLNQVMPAYIRRAKLPMQEIMEDYASI